MTDRPNCSIFCRKVHAGFLRLSKPAMGDRSSVAVSYLDFQIVHKLSRLSVTRYLPLLATEAVSIVHLVGGGPL